MRPFLTLGALLFFAGLFLIIYGSAGSSSFSGGGFILIGPFPVVFGTGPSGWELALLSVLVGIVMLITFGVLARRSTTAR